MQIDAYFPIKFLGIISENISFLLPPPNPLPKPFSVHHSQFIIHHSFHYSINQNSQISQLAIYQAYSTQNFGKLNYYLPLF